jgi:hypothetical protein
MDSRPILKDAKKVRVYLDSTTFNDLLTQKDRLAIAILRHYDSDCLEFVRSPLETTYDELKNVIEYELILDNNSKIESIKITRKEPLTEMPFRDKMDVIQLLAQKIYQKASISKEELNRIITVFLQDVSYRSGESNIYVTNDKILLRKRFWLKSPIPGHSFNIMSVEEASFFLDLFFKMNGKYYASSKYTLNKGGWYWLSIRLKIPHYLNIGDPMVDALAYRLYYALMALDEMGIQYYLGVDNDTMDNTLYHFNYLISLITGIFDNLALKTNTYLGINFSDLRKVSLSNKSGSDFLKEIREKNIDIRDHINSYVNFIRLIYSFRELVIHREGLSKTGLVGLEYGGEDARWKVNVIIISEPIKADITLCGDVNSKYDPFSKWGVLQEHTDLFLNPYHFSISAIAMLVKFVDKYLELLGYPSFIEAQTQNDDDFTLIKFFEKYHLGF